MELSEQVEAEFARILRGARAALQVDALAVVELIDGSARAVLTNSDEGFDVAETLITPLVVDPSIHQSVPLSIHRTAGCN